MITKKYVTSLSYDIVNCAIEVHKELGPGLLESIYEKCLIHELKLRGYRVINQVIVPIIYKGLSMEADIRLDILVEDLVVVELKAIENILPIHEAILLSYMKLLEKPQGLLINFHTTNIVKASIPLVNEYFKMLPDE